MSEQSPPPTAPDPGPPPRAGSLLVATPALVDPNFTGSVVLLLDVDADGVVGVVLNRPSPVPVAQVLPAWGSVVGAPAVLFHGGPVGVEGALAVGRAAEATTPEAGPPGFRPVARGLGLVDLDLPVEQVGSSLSELRIFAGYAGWGAEQLEGEIAEGSWWVVPGDPADPFGEEVDSLRRGVLRRQPGERAWLSTRPADPGLN